jgi:hypothetical protein
METGGHHQAGHITSHELGELPVFYHGLTL